MSTNRKMPIEEYIALQEEKLEDKLENGELEEEEVPGKIWHILRLYRAGYTKSEIVKAGYNRSTVYRQCGEYDKLRKAPAMSMFGLELYEARVKRMMATKKITRDEAVAVIAEKDIEQD